MANDKPSAAQVEAAAIALAHLQESNPGAFRFDPARLARTALEAAALSQPKPGEMGDDLDKLVADMRAGLEGVTPGPWTREEGAGKTFVCRGRHTILSITWGGNTGGNAHRDAAHIARCSPENIAKLLDALSAAQARAEALQRDHDALWKEHEELVEARKNDWAKHGGMEMAKGQWQARAEAAEAEIAKLEADQERFGEGLREYEAQIATLTAERDEARENSALEWASMKRRLEASEARIATIEKETAERCAEIAGRRAFGKITGAYERGWDACAGVIRDHIASEFNLPALSTPAPGASE